ncbi:hypothetical protein [Dactylosporangium salmoneum]|uniref:CBM6 domain-containing protein n=1 Tax=Dactylosporangium salmoneum TaxID=53361 RepID=A0ABN3HXY4_9ACTN
MIDGPADYTGRRRAGTHVQPRIVFIAVLLVVAAVALALRALPSRDNGHAEYAEGPVVPGPSATPAQGSPAASPPGSASPSAKPSSARPASASASPSRSSDSPTPGGAVSPSTGTTGTKSGVLIIEAEAPGNGRSGQMSVRDVPGASGGRVVTGVGNGHALQFAGVDVARRGEYKVTVAYLSTEQRQCYLGVGWQWLSVTFPASGGSGTVATVTVTMQLQAGRNTVEAGNTPGRWCPDLDRISVALS